MKKGLLSGLIISLIAVFIVLQFWPRHNPFRIWPLKAVKIVKQSRQLYDTLMKDVKVNFNAISFINPAHGVAVGDNGTIMLTKDGGYNWTRAGDTSIHANLYSVCMTKNKVIALGDKGTIVTHYHDSVNWISVYSGSIKFNQSFRNVAFYNSLNAYSVGDSGAIFYTSDAGGTWSKKHGNPSQSLNGLSYNSSNVPYAVGNKGLILKSTDYGATWDSVPSNTTRNLRSIHFAITDSPYVHADFGFAVGDSGIILKTVNGGVNWDATSLTSKNLHGVFLSSPSWGYAVGDSGTVLKYNGMSWNLLPRLTDKTLNAVDPSWWSGVDYTVGEGGVYALYPDPAADGSTLDIEALSSDGLCTFKLIAGSLTNGRNANPVRFVKFEACSSVNLPIVPVGAPGSGWAVKDQFYVISADITPPGIGNPITLPQLQLQNNIPVPMNGYITCSYKDRIGNFYLLQSWWVEYY